jgi:spore maturation protein CgeB
MDVNEAEDAIYSRDLTDVTDILKEMMRDEKERKKKGRSGK